MWGYSIAYSIMYERKTVIRKAVMLYVFLLSVCLPSFLQADQHSPSPFLCLDSLRGTHCTICHKNTNKASDVIRRCNISSSRLGTLTAVDRPIHQRRNFFSRIYHFLLTHIRVGRQTARYPNCRVPSCLRSLSGMSSQWTSLARPRSGQVTRAWVGTTVDGGGRFCFGGRWLTLRFRIRMRREWQEHNGFAYGDSPTVNFKKSFSNALIVT